MLSNLSIKARLIGSSVMAGGVISLLIGACIFILQDGTRDMESIYQERMVPSAALASIDSTLKDVRFRMSAYILDQMSPLGAKNHLAEARKKIPESWQTFKTGTQHNELSNEEKEWVASVEEQINKLPPLFDSVDQAYAKEDKETLTRIFAEDWLPVQKNITKPMEKLLPKQQDAVKAAYEENVAHGKKLMSMLILAGVFIVIIITIVATTIVVGLNRSLQSLRQTLLSLSAGDLTATSDIRNRDELGEMAHSMNDTIAHLRTIVQGVKTQAERVSDVSRGLNNDVHQVTGRASIQTDSIMEVSAAMEEVSVAVSEVARGVENVDKAADQAQQIARNSNTLMEKNAENTRRVVAAVDESSQTISDLSVATNKISEITNTIRDIADQTNLLALNAAIEAARAGEQGRGFAVVADEVRKLAERTATSTADITHIVNEVAAKTGQAVESMGRVKVQVAAEQEFERSVSTNMEEILVAASEVTQQSHFIVDATREQSSATQMTAQSMEKITALSEENNNTIQEVGHKADEMARTANDLQTLVGRFRL